MSTNSRTPLVIIEGNLTSRQYIDVVLETTYLPFWNKHPMTMPIHTHIQSLLPTCSKTMLMYCHGQPIPSIYPPSSMHLWDQLETSVSGCSPNPGNCQELAVALQEEWQNIHKITSDIWAISCIGIVRLLSMDMVVIPDSDICDFQFCYLTNESYKMTMFMLQIKAFHSISYVSVY